MHTVTDAVARQYLAEAALVAAQATCLRAQCGSVVVKNGVIIGRGFNSPPQNLEDQRRCEVEKSTYDAKVTDKTCCIHAEQRAILDALKKHPDQIHGARLYFIKLANGKPTFSGQPYCTVCSKLALEVGLAEFVLWHETGITVYNTAEYNLLSFDYKKLLPSD